MADAAFAQKALPSSKHVCPGQDHVDARDVDGEGLHMEADRKHDLPGRNFDGLHVDRQMEEGVAPSLCLSWLG